MTEHLPDDSDLTELAGEAAFGRGRGYHRAGRVALSQVSSSALAVEAHGTETYRLVYGNSNDSAGAIGDGMGEIAAWHAQASAASSPGKALGKSLHALQVRDGWGMLQRTTYRDALGPPGQAEYGRLVPAELERLPAPKADERYGESFEVVRRAETLARCSGDFDLLQRVLRRDLSHSHDHLRLLESLRESGRAREALAWAKAAVKRFPDDGRLRAVLADCLIESGMDEEALEQTIRDWRPCSRTPLRYGLPKDGSRCSRRCAGPMRGNRS